MLRLNRNAEALESFERGVQLDAKDPYSLFGRGIARQRLGRSEEARADKAAALAIEAKVESEYAKWGVK